MKITLQNGTQEKIDPDVIKHVIQNEEEARPNLTLSSITMFLNFYDSKGSLVDVCEDESFYLRSEKYLRERAGYEYISGYMAGNKTLQLYRKED